MSTDQMKTAKNIYSFIKQKIPPKLEKWIENAQKFETGSASSGSGGTYSTRKNSTKTMTAWRNKISFEEVEKIEKVCGKFMDRVGYIRIDSIEKLKNENIPVFTQFPGF